VCLRKAFEGKLKVEPKTHLLPPVRPELRGYGKFRVGPCRLICHRDDAVLLVLVIKVDHRRDVYR